MPVSVVDILLNGMIPTDSEVRGERRPMWSEKRPKQKENAPFSTGGFTGVDDYTGSRGSYKDLEYDKEVNQPYTSYRVGYPWQGLQERKVSSGEVRSKKTALDRQGYNQKQGPGSSSSRPKYPTNKRDEVLVGAKVLSKVLGKRKERREGGVPKDNRK